MKEFFILFFTVTSFAYSQNTTYSKYEESMITYASNSRAYAGKWDSLEIAQTALDSCWYFINTYPNSFAKLNILTWMLETTILLTDKLDKINPLIDSVLTYDQQPSTKLRIGKILIERNLDLKRGRQFVSNSFQELNVPFHKFRAYMLMARSDILLGNYSTAQNNYEKALELESNRIEVWYEYLGFTKMSEQPVKTKYILEKIGELESVDNISYASKSLTGPNINKSIQSISLKDMEGFSVKLKEFGGKIIVINRFGFWCSWCAKEFPTLQKIMKQFPEVVFLFVNDGESKQELLKEYFSKDEFSFLKDQNVLFVNKEYYDHVYGYRMPHTLVVDKNGFIRYDYVGYKTNLEELLISNLSKLISE